MASVFSYPLHQAIWNKDLKKVQRLVKIKTIEINKMDSFSGRFPDYPNLEAKISPLFVAIRMIYPRYKKIGLQILKVLLSHPHIDVNVAFSLDGTFGMSTLKNENSPHVLHFLIIEGALDLVKAFVKHPKIDVEVVSMGLLTAITDSDLCEPSNEKVQSEMIKILLEHPNIDVNKMTKTRQGDNEIVGYSALHHAIEREQVKNVKTLLEHPRILVNESAIVGNDEAKRATRYTPLVLSMWRRQKTTKITELLLKHPDIDVNKTEEDICLPLNLVPICDERTFSCFEMLLNHDKIDVNLKDKKYGSSLTPLMCLNAGEFTNKPNYPNIKKFHDEAFKMLLNHSKIDLTIQDNTGRNILHHLILRGVKYDIISDMFENHHNLITADLNGMTPIDLANESPDLMKRLLKKKYDEKIAETLKPFNYGVLFKANPNGKTSSKSEENLMKCCWNCDASDVKLYKCRGCKKAYYCTKNCLERDWTVHGGYCLKVQKRKEKSSS